MRSYCGAFYPTMNRLICLLAAFLFGIHKSAAFVFNASNKFNFTYPSDDWTHVPCLPGWGGNETCDTLTGTEATRCIEVTNLSSSGYFCYCSTYSGLTSSNLGCTFRDTSPRCFIEACEYIEIHGYVITIHKFCLAVVCLLKGLRCTFDLFRECEKRRWDIKNYRIWLRFFLFGGFPLVGAFAATDVMWTVLKSGKLTMAYQPFILTGLLLFLMGCLCTLFLLFFKLSAQKINVRNTLRKTMSGSHIFLFSVFAAVFSMIAIPLFQSGRDSDAALAYILTTTAVGGLFVFFGNGFLRSLNKIHTSKHSGFPAIRKTVRRVAILILAIVVCLVCVVLTKDHFLVSAFAYTLRSHAVSVIQFITFLTFCTIQSFLNDTLQKRSHRRSRRVRDAALHPQTGRLFFRTNNNVHTDDE